MASTQEELKKTEIDFRFFKHTVLYDSGKQSLNIRLLKKPISL